MRYVAVLIVRAVWSLHHVDIGAGGAAQKRRRARATQQPGGGEERRRLGVAPASGS